MAGPEPSRERHERHVAVDGAYSSYYADSVEVVFSDGPRGQLVVEMCTNCGYVWARCAHQSSSWNETGTVLTCDLCGTDGT